MAAITDHTLVHWPQVQAAIQNHDIADLFQQINAVAITREELNQLDPEDRMVKAAKFVLSLKEVKALEHLVINQYLAAFREKNFPANLLNQLEKSKEFKHLLSVPNRGTEMAGHPTMQQAFNDSAALETEALAETLKEIYKVAWSQVGLNPPLEINPPPNCNLVIFTQLNGLHYPNYAWQGLFEGKIAKTPEITTFAFPIAINQANLGHFSTALQNRTLKDAHIIFQDEFSEESMTTFFAALKQAHIETLELINFPQMHRQKAEELGIPVKFTALP